MAIKVGGARPHPQNGTVSRKGTHVRPAPYHGGSGAPHTVHDASKPQPRQSWHAMAAAARKRGT
jgi:hypothetical protein